MRMGRFCGSVVYLPSAAGTPTTAVPKAGKWSDSLLYSGSRPCSVRASAPTAAWILVIEAS